MDKLNRREAEEEAKRRGIYFTQQIEAGFVDDGVFLQQMMDNYQDR